MMKLLNIINFSQELALKRIEEYFKRRAKTELKEKVMKVIMVTKDVDRILRVLTDSGRYQRGRLIPDTEVVIEELSTSRIFGKVKNYIVEINLTEKKLVHNCDDWRKNVETGKFCKHLVKFFLKLPKDVALETLREIVKNMETWKFLAE